MMEALKSFSFGAPWFLLLLLLLPLLAWLLGGHGTPAAVRYSSASLLRDVGIRSRFGPRDWLWFLRLGALALVILGLARPRLERSESNQKHYGIDVVLICDVSGSMETKDFQQGTTRISRMEALIKAIGDFVKERPKDRTALVGFAADIYLLSPLTTDASWLPLVLQQIKLQGGTAIGEGIYAGMDVLEKSKAQSRIMIVVSDGFSNSGRPPIEAAKAARKKGIRVHTLQVMSFNEMARSKSGTSELAKVAKETGGFSYSAASTDALRKIYRDIDQLEKQRIEAKQFRLYDELFLWPVLAALALGLFELLAACTFWLRLP